MVTLAEQLRAERKKKIRLLLEILKSNKGEKADKALAWFCFQTGVAEYKAREYLRILVRSGMVTIQDGIIKEVKD